MLSTSTLLQTEGEAYKAGATTEAAAGAATGATTEQENGTTPAAGTMEVADTEVAAITPPKGNIRLHTTPSTATATTTTTAPAE